MSTCYTTKQAKRLNIIKTAALKVKSKHKARLRNHIEDTLVKLRMAREELI